MADPIKGVLEIRTDPGDETRVVLSPSSADITAGGNGGTGDLILLASNDKEVIRLGLVQETGPSQGDSPLVVAQYSGLRIRTPAGADLIRIGRIAAGASSVNPPDTIGVLFGGTGFSATLRLLDKDKKTRVVLGQDDQGNEARVIVLSSNAKKRLEFDSGASTLTIGGEGSGGDLVLRDAGENDRIRLESAGGDIKVLSADGKERLLFDSQYAALYVGGEGNEGDVIVRDQAQKERIKLDGGEGDIWVQNAAGKRLFHFDSEYAALYIGNEGNEGDVVVRNGDGVQTIKLDGGQGDIILSNADCAEEFDVAEPAPPGNVMVIGGDERLEISRVPYDRRVAGVISGAGSCRPGIVLDRRAVPGGTERPAVALAGKVYCQVDASYGPIAGGDLLVTSPTAGHAMAAADPARWPGAVLGKALRPWTEGRGLVPILVALQ